MANSPCSTLIVPLCFRNNDYLCFMTTLKILLLGDYSNVHNTLAQGLRSLGHEVVVASDGDGWKDYPRDVDLKRHSFTFWGTLRYYWKMRRLFRSFRGYDVVQLINPVFLSLKAERLYPFYRALRKHNKRVFLGAFGMDYYWVKAGTDCTTFRYSDFNIGSQRRESAENAMFIKDWYAGEKGRLNKFIANDCDGIISGLYEYHASYLPYHRDKLCFIPFPINPSVIQPKRVRSSHEKQIHFFIGVQTSRHAYKGTDVMLAALTRLQQNHSERCVIHRAESVPFAQYQDMMNASDVLLDQLYSYTPAMNALLAMAKGLVVVSGAEPEHYELMGEDELRPIINVQPNENDVYRALEELVLRAERLPELSAQSVTYVAKHHDYVKVARQYVDFWTKGKASGSGNGGDNRAK